jgi:uncharacterized membrane protein YdjX (TVP38/TMEM64 family)
MATINDLPITLASTSLATVAADTGAPGTTSRQPTLALGAPSTRWAGWTAALAIGSTLALVSVLSPGFRSDVGDIIGMVQRLDASFLRDSLLAVGPWAPLVYVLIVIAQVIIVPIPAAPLTIAGALLFGVGQGLALSLIGSIVGSVVVFALARHWGMPLVVHLVGADTVHRYAGKLDATGWWVFVVFLLPFLPDDAVCALAGLSAMSWRRFLVLVAVGRLPGTALTVWLTVGGLERSVTTWINIGIGMAVVGTLAWVYRKRLVAYITR